MPQLPNSSSTSFEIRGRKIEFTDVRHLVIDGKPKRLRHPLSGAKAGCEVGSQVVHIKDLVEALGGTYHYDPAFHREEITVRW